MRKLIVCLAAVFLFTGAAFAADNGVSTSPLKIWSTGVGVGGFYPLSDAIKDRGEFFARVAWMNSFDFTEDFALVLDINWYADKDFESLGNFGVDAGGDYTFLSASRVSPFLGAGIGLLYFGEKDSLDALAGLSVTARAGVALKLTETVDVKVRVPFHLLVGGDTTEMGVGFEVGVMFYSSLRGVKRLNY